MTSGKILMRIILDAAIFISVVNGWWHVALLLGLLGAWNFRYFAELFLAGVMYDALFGMVEEMGWWGYMGTIVSGIALIVTSFVKKIVRR